MSIRTVADRIKEQNALLVEMSGENQKNSESLQKSIGELNAVMSSIHKVLSDQKKEDDTEKSREELQDKDKEEERKSLFSGFLGQREGGKKDGKGMLGMIGKIFTKALGFLVTSLPLIGLAALFFGDVVTGLLTAAIGDYDQASILKNILAGGLIGSIFGFRGALVGAILGFLFSEATWSGLKDRWKELVAALSEGDWKTILSAMGSLAAALGGIGAAIVGLVATVIGPLKALLLAKKIFTRGTPAPVGGPMGPPLPKGPAPNPGQRQPQPKTQGRMGRALGGLRALGGRALGRVAPAVLMAPMLASVGANAVKNGATAVSKSAGSVIKSGASVAASAGGSVAKTVAGGMAGTSAKTILKKIPVIGALAGLGYGASRLIGGDVTGAGMEVLSGLASVVPGIGTAASLGIDAALIARDAGVFDKKSQEIETARNIKSEALNEATRERDELVAKTSSNVIMDNSTTNNVSGGGGGGVSISSPITFFDDQDPYLNSGR